jgi:TolB protein
MRTIRWVSPLLLVCTVLLSPATAPQAGATLPGTNGRLVFDRGTRRGTAIFTINPDGTNRVKVIEQISGGGHPQIIDPSWSPNGAKIAYERDTDRPFPIGFQSRIFTVNSDGTGATRLADGWSPAWSPNGLKIALNLSLGGIATVNPNGTGLTTVISNGEFPSWSPDGTKIAFDRHSTRKLAVMNSNGTGVSDILSVRVWGPVPHNFFKQFHIQRPVWTSDGSKILFIRWNGPYGRSDIWEVNADGSGLKRLTRTPSWPEDSVGPSPDGTRIAFTREVGGSGIYLMRPDGSHVKGLGRGTKGSLYLDWLAN